MVLLPTFLDRFAGFVSGEFVVAVEVELFEDGAQAERDFVECECAVLVGVELFKLIDDGDQIQRRTLEADRDRDQTAVLRASPCERRSTTARENPIAR